MRESSHSNSVRELKDIVPIMDGQQAPSLSFDRSWTSSRRCSNLVALGNGTNGRHLAAYRGKFVDVFSVESDDPGSNPLAALQAEDSDVCCMCCYGDSDGVLVLIGAKDKPYKLRLYGDIASSVFLEQDVTGAIGTTGRPLFMFTTASRLFVQCFDPDTCRPSVRIDNLRLLGNNNTTPNAHASLTEKIVEADDRNKAVKLPDDFGRLLSVDGRGRFLGVSSSLILYLVDKNTAHYLDLMPYVSSRMYSRTGARSACFIDSHNIIVSISSSAPMKTLLLHVSVAANGQLLPPSVVLDRDEPELEEAAEIVRLADDKVALLLWDEKRQGPIGDRIRVYSVRNIPPNQRENGMIPMST